jgi:hypothetical protein
MARGKAAYHRLNPRSISVERRQSREGGLRRATATIGEGEERTRGGVGVGKGSVDATCSGSGVRVHDLGARRPVSLARSARASGSPGALHENRASDAKVAGGRRYLRA